MNPVFWLISLYYKMFERELEGRKKLQKLLFLVEHWEKGRIVRSLGLTGYRFKVYYYGPFSKEVYDDLDLLRKRGLIEEEVVIWTRQPMYKGILVDGYVDDCEVSGKLWLYKPKVENSIPKNKTTEKMKLIIKEFGGYTPSELEIKVNRMLKLTPIKKLKFMNKSIDEYLAISTEGPISS